MFAALPDAESASIRFPINRATQEYACALRLASQNPHAKSVQRDFFSNFLVIDQRFTLGRAKGWLPKLLLSCG